MFVPQHLDIGHSYLGRGGRHVLMGLGLTMGNSSRLGLSRHWDMVSGQCMWRWEEDVVALSVSPIFYRSHVVTWKLSCPGGEHGHESHVDQQRQHGGAMFVPVNSIDILHSHLAEAAKQLNNLKANLKGINWFQMSSQTWRYKKYIFFYF